MDTIGLSKWFYDIYVYQNFILSFINIFNFVNYTLTLLEEKL